MPDGKSMAKASRDVGSTTRIFPAQRGTATTRLFTEQLDPNFNSLSALMPDGKSMAKASRDVGSTTRIFSASRGTATTRPFTGYKFPVSACHDAWWQVYGKSLARCGIHHQNLLSTIRHCHHSTIHWATGQKFQLSVCHDAWWQVDGKSFARCVLAHGSSRLAMKSFLSSKHVSATPKIKSCSKPIHGSSTYYANIAAWWRLVNSFWQLVGPPVLYSDVCSVTFTASVVMLQATAGARTWGHGPESLQEGLSIFGFWRIAKENPITSCQLFESIWNRVKIQAQWNYGTLSRDAKGCKGNHNCFWCLSNSLTNWTTQISRVSQIAVDHL